MESIKVLTFMLNDKKYGISIENVVTIEKNDRAITKIPQSNELIRGVVNIRGKVCPVIDLKKFFNDTFHTLEEESKLILVELEDNLGALLVDDTDNIIDVSVEAIEEFEIEEDKQKTKLINIEGEIFVLLEVNVFDDLFNQKDN